MPPGERGSQYILSNISDLQARANIRGADYYRMIGAAPLDQTYLGLIPFAPGSVLTSVEWRGGPFGVTTHIKAGPVIQWPGEASRFKPLPPVAPQPSQVLLLKTGVANADGTYAATVARSNSGQSPFNVVGFHDSTLFGGGTGNYVWAYNLFPGNPTLPANTPVLGRLVDWFKGKGSGVPSPDPTNGIALPLFVFYGVPSGLTRTVSIPSGNTLHFTDGILTSVT
jgi:hypothetical protein